MRNVYVSHSCNDSGNCNITYYDDGMPRTYTEYGNIDSSLRRNNLVPCILHVLDNEGKEKSSRVVSNNVYLSTLKRGDKFKFHEETALDTELIFTMCVTTTTISECKYIYCREDNAICGSNRDLRVVPL